jgi:hypothetical protein
MNALTSVIDGNMVYGSTPERAFHLRSFKGGVPRQFSARQFSADISAQRQFSAFKFSAFKFSAATIQRIRKGFALKDCTIYCRRKNIPQNIAR